MAMAKLVILSFLKDDYLGVPVPFELMYNPSKFSQRFENQYSSPKTIGDSSQEARHTANESDDIAFEFLFDATGASVNSIAGRAADALGGIDVLIEAFLELTQKIAGESHQPRKLILVWGPFIFKGVLISADINYTLFNSIGRPLRATVNATFRRSVPKATEALETKRFSNDLTKEYFVTDSDTLPLIAWKKYSNPELHWEIAMANDLDDIRNIKPGTTLMLPPVKK